MKVSRPVSTGHRGLAQRSPVLNQGPVIKINNQNQFFLSAAGWSTCAAGPGVGAGGTHSMVPFKSLLKL